MMSLRADSDEDSSKMRDSDAYYYVGINADGLKYVYNTYREEKMPFENSYDFLSLRLVEETVLGTNNSLMVFKNEEKRFTYQYRVNGHLYERTADFIESCSDAEREDWNATLEDCTCSFSSLMTSQPETRCFMAESYTHYLSFPFKLPFVRVIEAAETFAKREQSGDIHFFVWMIAENHHLIRSSMEEEYQRAYHAIRRAKVFCQIFQNDPILSPRAFTYFELVAAMCNGCDLVFLFPPRESKSLGDELSKPDSTGEETILARVYDFCNNVFQRLQTPKFDDGHRDAIKKLVEDNGGFEDISIRLSSFIRAAYANAAGHELARRLEIEDTDLGKATSTMKWKICHIWFGLRISKLWAVTGDTEKVKRLMTVMCEWCLDNMETPVDPQLGKVFCELVTFLVEFHQGMENSEETVESAQKMITKILDDDRHHDKLGVYWKGVSTNYVRNFVSTRKPDLEWLQTKAVVERLVKPENEFQAMLAGLEDEAVGRPILFVSHAWKSSFEDLVNSLPNKLYDEENYCIWLDIFCVNQHQTAPEWLQSGSLMAFAFDPLHKAMLNCKVVGLFFESWYDPSPLSRIWSLYECLSALLLGKPVEVFMPPRERRKFGELPPEEASKHISRITGRIDIIHADAWSISDRKEILKIINETVGIDLLNRFCKEIVSQALRKIWVDENDASADIPITNVSEDLRSFFQSLRSRGEESSDFGKRVPILRGVTLMKLRCYDCKDENYREAVLELKELLSLCKMYYGEKAQITRDIQRVYEQHDREIDT